MALKMWELLIPKISLNILSIIYEQFDYEKMLENKSTEIISQRSGEKSYWNLLCTMWKQNCKVFASKITR